MEGRGPGSVVPPVEKRIREIGLEPKTCAEDSDWWRKLYLKATNDLSFVSRAFKRRSFGRIFSGMRILL